MAAGLIMELKKGVVKKRMWILVAVVFMLFAFLFTGSPVVFFLQK
ncbi:hypothetical protein ES708_22902 [subsurface metagenome]